MDTGITTNDFSQIISDMGVTVSYSVVTITRHPVTGDETTTFATASDQTVIFFLEQNRYIWDKEGLLEVGDAYIIAPLTLGIKRYDQFTYDSRKYYIQNVINRYVSGVEMCDYAV